MIDTQEKTTKEKGEIVASLRIIWTLAKKDLLLEVRNREIVVSIAVFALLVLAIFSFTLDLNNLQQAKLVGPGVLWTGIAFAGVIGINRSFSIETEHETLDGLMLAPISRDLLFLGKTLGNFLFLLISQILIIPVFALLFNAVIFRPEMLVICLLTTIGFSSVGTIFGALAARARSREIMLPMLFLPVISPLMLAAIEVTSGIVKEENSAYISKWMQLAIGFDLVFLILSAVLFHFVLED